MPFEELGKLAEEEGDNVIARELVVLGRAKSRSYVADTSGWIIEGDGSAQFNNLNVTGVINATAGSDVDWSYISNVSIENADIVSLSFAKITSATNNASLTVSGDITMTGGSSIIRTGTGSTRVELQSAFTDRVAFYFNNNYGYIAGTTGNSLQFVPPGGSVEYAIYTTYTQHNQQVRFTNGTDATPGWVWQGSTNTGARLSGSAETLFVVSGSGIANVRSTGFSPWTDLTYDLGHSGRYWDVLWYQTLTQSSDANRKDNIAPLTFDAVQVVKDLQPKRFNFKSNGRAAVGFVAQDVKAALQGKHDDAFFEDENGMGIRPDELNAIAWQALRDIIVRVEALENA